MLAGQEGVDGLDDAADEVGGASCLTEDAPGVQPGEGVFARRSEVGMDAVEPLVVVGEFAVSVAGGAGGGADTLVCAVGQDQDFSGEAGLDDVVGPGGGQIMRVRGQRAGEPQRCATGRATTWMFVSCFLCFWLCAP